eukprot:264773-Rhodomonas_salina.1
MSALAFDFASCALFGTDMANTVWHRATHTLYRGLSGIGIGHASTVELPQICCAVSGTDLGYATACPVLT